MIWPRLFPGMAVAAFLVVAAGFFHLGHPSRRPIRVKVTIKHVGCFEQVRRQFFICPDGRSFYVDTRGRWHFAGPATPMPLVPAR